MEARIVKFLGRRIRSSAGPDRRQSVHVRLHEPIHRIIAQSVEQSETLLRFRQPIP